MPNRPKPTWNAAPDMAELKQLEVQIMGQSYLLTSQEGGQSQLLEAVERVDTAMCKIRDAGKVRARDRIAVLAALNVAFDLSAPSLVPVPPASHDTAGRPSEDSGQPNAMLSQLLVRLDSALGEDGNLI